MPDKSDLVRSGRIMLNHTYEAVDDHFVQVVGEMQSEAELRRPGDTCPLGHETRVKVRVRLG